MNGPKGTDAHLFYEMMTAPTTKILDKWFESEPLKATLATDACIGAMISPCRYFNLYNFEGAFIKTLSHLYTYHIS